MPITIDGQSKLMTLDSTAVTAVELWSAWVDWLEISENRKWSLAFSLVGTDPLGEGIFVPPYFFLLNGWRVRPMEADHDLTVDGNLFVQGGGVPVIRTLGQYQVNVRYVVPLAALAYETGGSTGPTAEQIAAAVRASIATELALIRTIPALF